MDKYLEQLITPYIKGKKLKIPDACCGLGHILYLLNQISPQSEYLGIDFKDYLVEESKKLWKDYDNIKFMVLDAFNLSKSFNKEFDVCINWKTLSWLPYYEELMNEMVKATKKHIFVSSLFYEGNIDSEIKIREYDLKGDKNDFNAYYYNVYSYPKFERYCYSLGVRNVEPYDFQIGIDLPKPADNRMGTYTVKLEDGKKLQISGVVMMLWKIIRIDI